MLLYPVINERRRMEVQLQGQRFRVATVNLAQDWPAIEEERLELIA